MVELPNFLFCSGPARTTSYSVLVTGTLSVIIHYSVPQNQTFCYIFKPSFLYIEFTMQMPIITGVTYIAVDLFHISKQINPFLWHLARHVWSRPVCLAAWCFLRLPWLVSPKPHSQQVCQEGLAGGGGGLADKIAPYISSLWWWMDFWPPRYLDMGTIFKENISLGLARLERSELFNPDHLRLLCKDLICRNTDCTDPRMIIMVYLFTVSYGRNRSTARVWWIFEVAI